MSSYNRVILVAHLGRDAELRFTTAGTAVTTLNVATSESWTDKKSDVKHETVEWHRVVLFGKQAESLAPFLLKGRLIAVEGKLTHRSYMDKEGVKKYTTEVRADRVVLLSGGGKPASGPAHVRDEDVAAGGEPSIHLGVPDESETPF